jgi:hypothetical protein
MLVISAQREAAGQAPQPYHGASDFSGESLVTGVTQK